MLRKLLSSTGTPGTVCRAACWPGLPTMRARERVSESERVKETVRKRECEKESVCVRAHVCAYMV